MKLVPYLLLALVIVLGAVFFLSYPRTPSTVEAPLTLPAVEQIERVEVIRPDGEKRAMLVFEKSDGAWWITRPIEARASEAAEVELNGLFAQPIVTDDLKLDPKKLDAYGLNEASVVQVSVYDKGRAQAALTLDIGKEIQIPQTGVRRTYLKTAQDARVYRAQIGMGRFFRAPIGELRTRRVIDLDASGIRALNIQAAPMPEGEAAEASPRYHVKLIHKDYVWALAEPALEADSEVAQTLDLDKVNALVGVIAGLRAEAFVDDKKPADVGLEPASVSMIIETLSGTHILGFGDAAPGPSRYARFDDGPIFTLSESTSARLQPSAASLLKTSENPTPADAENAAAVGAN